MIKRFTPLAVLFGLLTAMLLGSASMAQATPLLDFQCNNVVGVGVICENDIVKNVKVTITDNEILNDIEIITLENVLNNVEIDVIDNVYIQNIKADVVEVYNNEFDIDIDVKDVDVDICVAFC